MKIAIFETEHFEVAYPVIKLFDQPGNQITVITNSSCFERFKELFMQNMDRYHWVILPMGKFGFFRKFYNSLKKSKPDLLYLNTVNSNHLLYAKLLARLHLKRIILTVHDINCLFESRFQWNFRPAIIHWGKKALIKLIREYNVISDTLLDHLKQKAPGKTVHSISGGLFENRSPATYRGGKLRVVIPGSIDKKRRDYEQVFELALIADKQKFPLELIFLGGFVGEYGKNILQRAAQFNSEYATFTTYETEVVDQFEFDRQMDGSHFVFIPSVVETKICGQIPETYGITKSSGNLFDVIKHAKPFISPAALNVSEQLHSSRFTYQSVPEIGSFLQSILKSPGAYQDWVIRATDNSRHFTIEKLREKNSYLFG